MSDRILVVEDEPEVEELVASYLRARGRQVQVVDSLERAMAVLGRSEVEVMLTDVKLPDGSGLDLARQAVRRGVRVVVTTGYPSVELAVEAWRAGADDFVPKPYRLRDVFAALERASARGVVQRESVALRTRLELLLAAERLSSDDGADALLAHLLLVLSGLPGVVEARLEAEGEGLPLGPDRVVAVVGDVEAAAPYVAAVARALQRCQPR